MTEDPLRVLTDDDGRRVLLLLGLDSKLEARNHGRLLLDQIIEQHTAIAFAQWEWDVQAVPSADGEHWDLLAEHDSCTRKGQPFER